MIKTEFAELNKYYKCEDGSFQYDLDRTENDNIPVKELERYEIVFEINNNKYYCFTDAMNGNEALGNFFVNHPNVRFTDVIEILEV